MAAAGLWTTPTDLAKVGVEIMQVLHGKSTEFLSKETIEEMLRPQTEQLKGANGLFYGLGFAGNGIGDGSYFFHEGTNVGFIASTRFYSRIGKGVVIMLNSNEGEPLREEIMKAIALEYNYPDASPQERKTVTLSQLDSYSGVYLTKSGLQFKVINRDNNLFLECQQQPLLQLFPTSELEFFAKAVNANISFEKDNAGNITVMILNQAGVMSLIPQADKHIRAEKIK